MKPEILKAGLDILITYSKKPRLETKNLDPYKDITEKHIKVSMTVEWQHNTLDKKGKTKYLVYLSSTIYRNDKLGPYMNRVAFTIRDKPLKELKLAKNFKILFSAVHYVCPKLKIFKIVNNCGQTAARFISAACIFMKKYTKEINT